MLIHCFALEKTRAQLDPAKVCPISISQRRISAKICYTFKGDSGSGLVLERNETWALVGIVSAGATRSGTCDLPNYVLYTDVSKYYEWIYQVVLETLPTKASGALPILFRFQLLVIQFILLYFYI